MDLMILARNLRRQYRMLRSNGTIQRYILIHPSLGWNAQDGHTGPYCLGEVGARTIYRDSFGEARPFRGIFGDVNALP